jgi:hypothetical protein
MATEVRHLLGGQQTGDMLGGLIMRALQDPESEGRWNAAAMRKPGFQLIEQALYDPQFRALAPLPEKAQVVLDNAVVKVGLDRLTVAAAIINAGLVYNLTDPLSVTQLEWYAQSKAANAFRSMSPESRNENYLTDLLQSRLPIYLTKAQFDLDIRSLRMSQRVGMPLDTSLISEGTRAVNESIEDATINGTQTLDGQDLAVAGYKAPGLLNAPNHLSATLSAVAWGMVSPVASTIFQDVQGGLAALRANKKYGPYYMFVPTAIGGVLDNDYGVSSPGVSINERLSKINGLTIETADLMPPNKVVIVQMTDDVVDMVVGQRPTVIPWTSVSGFTFHNMIMAIMIPRVRSDYNGKSGIWVGTIQ